MEENRVMFYKSYIPEVNMESISHINYNKAFKNISIDKDNKFFNKYNRLCWMSPIELKFREMQNPYRRKLSSTLNFIFVPPGFSYLFEYYDTFTCKLVENIYELVPKYSYLKKSANERYTMDPLDEELRFGYVSNGKGKNKKYY